MTQKSLKLQNAVFFVRKLFNSAIGLSFAGLRPRYLTLVWLDAVPAAARPLLDVSFRNDRFLDTRLTCLFVSQYTISEWVKSNVVPRPCIFTLLKINLSNG